MGKKGLGGRLFQDPARPGAWGQSTSPGEASSCDLARGLGSKRGLLDVSKAPLTNVMVQELP